MNEIGHSPGRDQISGPGEVVGPWRGGLAGVAAPTPASRNSAEREQGRRGPFSDAISSPAQPLPHGVYFF